MDPEQARRISQLLDQSRGTAEFVKLVGKYSSEEHYPDLLRLTVTSKDRQLAADAMGVLMDKQQTGKVYQFIVNADDQTRKVICDALVSCGRKPATMVLAEIARQADLDRQLRTYAIKRLGQIPAGATDMLSWIEKNENIDPVIMPAVVAALHLAPWPNINLRANKLFPIAATKDNRILPPIDKLVGKKGDAGHGKDVFEGIGTCVKCHVVHGKGTEVGPDLSEIGNKLDRVTLYESILFPSADIHHDYENWMVLKHDGQALTGTLVGETESEIQIKDDKGVNHVISVDEIDSRKKQNLSLMPADLHKELTEQDLVDVVAYLMTLKR